RIGAKRFACVLQRHQIRMWMPPSLRLRGSAKVKWKRVRHARCKRRYALLTSRTSVPPLLKKLFASLWITYPPRTSSTEGRDLSVTLALLWLNSRVQDGREQYAHSSCNA